MVLVTITDLENMEVTRKKEVLTDLRHSMDTPYAGNILYPSETLTGAFE